MKYELDRKIYVPVTTSGLGPTDAVTVGVTFGVATVARGTFFKSNGTAEGDSTYC